MHLTLVYLHIYINESFFVTKAPAPIANNIVCSIYFVTYKLLTDVAWETKCCLCWKLKKCHTIFLRVIFRAWA